MNEIKPLKSLGLLVFACFLVVGLACEGVSGQGLRTTARMRSVLERLDTHTDRFSKSVDAALDRSRLDDSKLEDQVNGLVDEFEFATERLNERAKDNLVISLDINEVLRRGMHIDRFMQTHNLAPVAERDWRLVRSDLDRLARVSGVAWTWAPNAVRNSARNLDSTKQVMQRLEDTADTFRTSFDTGLDRSKLDGSSYEDFMNNVVARFEGSLDKLEDQADDKRPLNAADVKAALNDAAAIDNFLRRQHLDARTQRDWARVKTNLDDLAFLNQVAWDWTVRPNNVAPIVRNVQAQGERVGLDWMANPPRNAVVREVRHELLSDLPYYSVFDWIEFEVLPDNTVVLRGEVTTPPDTKSRAEDVVEKVSGVRRVVNEIRVLPVSPNDDRLRHALYSAIYGFNSPLFRYGVGSRRGIHILVDRGRATLKGTVDSQADKQVAYQRARSVPGLFAVNNELMVTGEKLVR